MAAMGPVQSWPLPAAWDAAVEVTAAVYGVAPGPLRAPSRGRGPRPPERAREPKKVAVWLAVLLSGRDYKAVARFLGLHKDTVSSHCADIREEAIDDARERQLDALAAAATVRLELGGAAHGNVIALDGEGRAA